MNQRQKDAQSAVSEDGHIESQPIPGHTEHISTNPAEQERGPNEDLSPTAGPDTKPGTPPGTQSESDRLKTPEAGNPI